MGLRAPLIVEVFPVEPYRWIAVIAEFSTEVTTAREVDDDVRASIRSVLKVVEPNYALVDDLGAPWTARDAPAQIERLGIVFSPSSWRPDLRPSWRRILPSRHFPSCPACGHAWRAHVPESRTCAACVDAIDRRDPHAPTIACTLEAPTDLQRRLQRGFGENRGA